MEPAYEEVFDRVEEMILRQLHLAFMEMKKADELDVNESVEQRLVKRTHERGAQIMNKYGPRGLFKKSNNQRYALTNDGI